MKTKQTDLLLWCGIFSSLFYVAMNVIVPLQWPGYDPAAQVVSELSAIGAPTRPLWVALGMVWGVLVAAFGIAPDTLVEKVTISNVLEELPLPVLTATGFTRLAWILTAFLCVSGLIGTIWAPRHEGKSLEQIEAERA